MRILTRILKAGGKTARMVKGMELGGDFCIICGSPPPLLHERMCESCLRQRTTLAEIPSTVQHQRCARCGLVEVQGRWIEIADDDLWEELTQRVLKVHEDVRNLNVVLSPQRVDERNTRLHLELIAEIHGMQMHEQHEILARMSNGVCLTCTRRAGNYFEATVQLRSAGRRLDEIELTEMRGSLNSLIAEMQPDPMFFITDEGPVQGGYDVVMGSKSLARTWGRRLMHRWGGQVKETNSVVGRKDGADLTRLTLLYRRPAYDVGDVVRWRDSLWRISSWSNDGAVLSKVEYSQRTGLSWRDLEKAQVLSRQRDHIVVELLNVDSSAGEFLDPRNWRTSIVRLPYDHQGYGSVRLAEVEGEWVALPRLNVDKEEE